MTKMQVFEILKKNKLNRRKGEFVLRYYLGGTVEYAEKKYDEYLSWLSSYLDKSG